MNAVSISLESFPMEGGGEFVLLDDALSDAAMQEFRIGRRAFAIELRKAAPAMLASAVRTLKMDEKTRAVRYRIGSVELVIMNALVPFEGKSVGILCAVLPSNQLAGEKAVARFVSKVREQLEGLS